jgi:hypothetical protein
MADGDSTDACASAILSRNSPTQSSVRGASAQSVRSVCASVAIEELNWR